MFASNITAILRLSSAVTLCKQLRILFGIVQLEKKIAFSLLLFYDAVKAG